MELRVDREKLKERRLFVGTPMYGGQCHVDFAFSIAQLSALCAQLGIGLRYHFLCNESLVMRARNLTADEFLRSDDTHLMFIDADMGFDPVDVIAMLAMQDPDPAKDDHDVIAAPYPLKTFAWDNIARAVKMGAADRDPGNLEKYVGPVVFNPIGEGPFALQQPVEANVAGTAFMMIRRATFERFRAAHPAQAFKPDEKMRRHPVSPELFAFFDTAVDNKMTNIAEEARLFLEAHPHATRDDLAAFIADPAASMKSYSHEFIAEDFMFCRRVRDIGMKLWLCPWMQLTHTGTYTFTSSLPHVNAMKSGRLLD